MALRALASDLLDITILAPDLKFINLSMSVDQPFKPQRVRGVRLQETAAELGARWHQGTLDRVEPERNRVITRDGDEVAYDMLLASPGWPALTSRVPSTYSRRVGAARSQATLLDGEGRRVPSGKRAVQSEGGGSERRWR